MESTSEGKERMDALSETTLVVVVLSSLCFFRFLFISFVFFEFGFCGPFQAKIVWTDLVDLCAPMTPRDAQCFKICSRNLRFGIWSKRGKTNRDATKMTTVVASATMVEQT